MVLFRVVVLIFEYPNNLWSFEKMFKGFEIFALYSLSMCKKITIFTTKNLFRFVW